jgi:hypothetical protein
MQPPGVRLRPFGDDSHAAIGRLIRIGRASIWRISETVLRNGVGKRGLSPGARGHEAEQAHTGEHQHAGFPLWNGCDGPLINQSDALHGA